MSGISLLHLTDIHFGWESGSTTSSAERTLALNGLLDAVKNLAGHWKPNIVCLTGDIAWRGTQSDYSQAKTWLLSLLQVLGLNSEDLLVCPGNHDVNRLIAIRSARPTDAITADRCLRTPIAGIPTSHAFAEYNRFCSEIGIRPYQIDSEQSYLVGVIEHKGVQFAALNSAWYCQGDDDQKKLWIGLPFLKVLEAHGQLSRTSVPNTKPTICLIHHPPDWWNDQEIHASSDRPNLQDYLAHRCHLILSGHTHGEVRKADRIASSAFHLTGGSSFAGASHFNSFRLIHLDGNQIEYRSFEFNPGSADSVWRDCWGVERVTFDVKLSEENRVVAAQTRDYLPLLRDESRRSALRTVERKSRQIKPIGQLPELQPLNVSLRVTEQVPAFDKKGRLSRPKDETVLLPLADACRVSARRRTILLGDMGSGKTTLAARLISEIIELEPHTVAFMVEAKSLRLPESFTAEELLTAVSNAFKGETAGRCQSFDMATLLGGEQEFFMVIDGLDEVSRAKASRILRQCEVITETWHSIKLLATGRPIELTGVGYQSWTVCYFEQLSDRDRLRLLEAEAVAANSSTPTLDAKRLLETLKQQPLIDDIATTPLVIRLLYPRLTLETQANCTVGDLLYDLLLERLGKWDEKEDKVGPYVEFNERFQTSESRAPLLGDLAIAARVSGEMSRDQAIEAIRSSNELSQQLATETINYFESIGLISGQAELNFTFQPLLDVAVGMTWLEKDQFTEAQVQTFWRGISFAAAAARRRRSMERLRPRLEKCLAFLLQDPVGISAGSSLVSESQDGSLAQKLIELLKQLGRKPIRGGRDDRYTSFRAIADTIRLAGNKGFDWFISEYLDARFPIVHRGSIVPECVFKEWVWLNRNAITEHHKTKLRPLVAPLIRCGGLFDLLPSLALVVPEAFSETELVWYLASSLDNKTFGEDVERRIRVLVTAQNRDLIRDILIRRLGPHSIAMLLDLFPQEIRKPEVLKGIARWKAKSATNEDPHSLASCFLPQIEPSTWTHFLRWLISEPDRNSYLSPSAAVLLYDLGGHQHQEIGTGLMEAVYCSFPNSENRLREFVHGLADQGLQWLVSQMVKRGDLLGGHESWWRLLLRRLSEGTSPDTGLLCQALPLVGPFLLSRYPEVRHGFFQLLSNTLGQTYHQALHQQLHSPDSRYRYSAACILTVTTPSGEAEALYEVVGGRGHHRFDSMEWETFVLTLAFSYSVLNHLYSCLAQLGREERVFAYAILYRHHFTLQNAEENEFYELLLELGNWQLRIGVDGQSLFASENRRDFLLSILKGTNDSKAVEASRLLLEFHFERLNEDQKTQCWAKSIQRDVYHPDKVKSQLLRIFDDPSYREEVRKIRRLEDKSEQYSVLDYAINAIDTPLGWNELVWAMLCGNRGFLSETEDAGELLLDIGRIRPQFAKNIGESARLHLDDPRIGNELRNETRHWLALLAHEFGELPTSEIVKYVTKPAINTAAIRALLARLGNIPPDTVRRQYPGDFPANIGQLLIPPISRTELVDRLISYGRASDQLHPDTCNAIEQFLLHEEASPEELETIAKNDFPGLLISESLRFCYGRLSKVEDQALLTRNRDYHESWNTNPCFKRLLWMSETAKIMAMENSEWKNQYLGKLKLLMHSESNPLSLINIAIGLLQTNNDLEANLEEMVFEKFAKNHSRSHSMLGRLLVSWFLSLDDSRKSKTQALARRCTDMLIRRDRLASAGYRSPYPYLLFPLIEFSFTKEARRDAIQVYLEGLTLIFSRYQQHQGEIKSRQILADFERLVRMVPDQVWVMIRTTAMQSNNVVLYNLIIIAGGMLSGRTNVDDQGITANIPTMVLQDTEE